MAIIAAREPPPTYRMADLRHDLYDDRRTPADEPRESRDDIGERLESTEGYYLHISITGQPGLARDAHLMNRIVR